jgi:hypothetical protein
MLLGPFADKSYEEVKVASIQCNRLPRRLAKCGQSVSLGFHKLGNFISLYNFELFCGLVEQLTCCVKCAVFSFENLALYIVLIDFYVSTSFPLFYHEDMSKFFIQDFSRNHECSIQFLNGKKLKETKHFIQMFDSTSN